MDSSELDQFMKEYYQEYSEHARIIVGEWETANDGDRRIEW